MLKLEQICFGNPNIESRTQFPITMYEHVHLKYCVVLTIQGISIQPQRWYIRSDNLQELYTESYRLARNLIKMHCIHVIVLTFARQNRNGQHWHYYSPMPIYK